MKTVKIILIAALVLAVGLSFFACRKTDPAGPGPTEQTGPEITLVNEAVKADFWILPDTEANRKTSLWGTASADDLEAGGKIKLKIGDPGDGGTYLVRVIDADGGFYSADGLTLAEGYTLRLTEEENLMAARIEVLDENGELIFSEPAFVGRL